MRRTTTHIALHVMALSAMAQEHYVVEPLRIAPAAVDYAPVLVDSTLVFCSLRLQNDMVTYRNEATDDTFSDLYRIDLREGHERTPHAMGDALTTALHDGPATFTDGGRTVCFTRNLHALRKLANTRATDDRLGLFFSHRIGSDWTVPEPFLYNGDVYSVMHATISADGRHLVFASDMPGGQGGFDLYRCERDGDDWDIPVNLGPAVNSSGNDVFPFIAANGTLYFSSDRPGGLGGLDILQAAWTGRRWDSPRALPEPVNSAGNDLGYTSYPTDRSGFFSSDRDGEDRILSFRRMMPLFRDCAEQQPNNYCYQFKAPADASLAGLPLRARWDLGDGNVIDGELAEHCYSAPGQYAVRLDLVDSISNDVFFSKGVHELPIEDIRQAYITSLDSIRSGRRMTITGAHSNLPGFGIEEYHWDLGDGTTATGRSVAHTWRTPGTYTVRLSVLGMDADGIHLKEHCVSRPLAVIQRFDDMEDPPVVAQYQDGAGALRSFTYQSLSFEEMGLTIIEGEDGIFSIQLLATKERISLDDPRFAEVRRLYRVIERYDPERGVFTYSVGDSKDLAGIYEVYRKVKDLMFLEAEVVMLEAENLTDLSSLSLLSEAELDNAMVRDQYILFHSGKADVPDAYMPRLEKLADLLRTHPTASLVVEAHTDDVGRNDQNLKLSQLRAQRIVDNLVRMGIARDRLVPVGHGENQPIASNDDEAGRGLNRRVEFRISMDRDQAYKRR
jgi:outer membrane protein OmpA-like peptidoglycan-associated protein